jgi:O-antigen/teichoic acid export membrane protein
MISKSKVNYIYNLGLTVVNLVFPILSFPYASRILGPAGIGKVQFITSFAQYFALFASLGIPVYGIREIARARGDKLQVSKTFTELMTIFLVTSLIMGIAYLVFAFNLEGLKMDLQYHLYASMIVFLGFSSIDWFYAGIEEFKVIAIRSTIIKLMALIALYAFVKTTSDLFIYFIITIFSILANNIINIFSVWKKVDLVIRDLDFKRHKRPLLLIFGTTIASSMYTLFDVILLRFLSSEEAVGYYTSGVKLAKVTIPFVVSMGVVLVPKITTYLHEKNFTEFNSIIVKSYSFIILIAVPTGFGFLLLAKEFILVFSGPAFSDAILSMEILSFLPLFIGIGYLLGIQILIPSGNDKGLFISVVAGMCTSLLLNFLLVPRYHQEGAAIANLLSEIAVSASYFYFVKKNIPVHLPISYLGRAILSSLVFIPVVFLFRYLFPENYYLILLGSVGCSAALYGMIQLFVFKNALVLEIVNSILRKKNLKQS